MDRHSRRLQGTYAGAGMLALLLMWLTVADAMLVDSLLPIRVLFVRVEKIMKCITHFIMDVVPTRLGHRIHSDEDERGTRTLGLTRKLGGSSDTICWCLAVVAWVSALGTWQ